MRRFAPEPVETSVKSSRPTRQEPETGDLNVPRPRRFMPQPVETSVKSSRKRTEPETGDLSKPQPRRFAPQPVETSVKSSKDKRPAQDGQQKPRKFAPEPVETTSRSSRGNSTDTADKPRPKSRFAPQPIETTQSSSRGRQKQGAPHIKFDLQAFATQGSSSKKAGTDVAPHEPEPEPRPVRKFTPILLDTAKRSRRANDNDVSLRSANRTEFGYKLAAKEHRRHITGNVTPAVESSDSDTEMIDAVKLDASRVDHGLRLRPLSPMDGGSRPQGRFTERSHSFRCPELDTIESSESEPGSKASSLSSSPAQGSPITASDSSYPYPYPGFKDATRVRESVDENFHNYLLKLEAKKAEERMREQALAAFPNSDFHEPVMHYVDEEETESEHSVEDRPATWEGHEEEEYTRKVRRDSTKVPWEQLEMQRHAERMEQERMANQTTAKPHTKQASHSPWWNPGLAVGTAPVDRDFRDMQDRARPPMLGDDITFPRCRSPSPARFDVTQGSTALRNQMCYLTEHADLQRKEEESDEPHLWSGQTEPKTHFTSIKTPQATQGSPSQTNRKGLWGGFCAFDDDRHPGSISPPPGAISGLLTPRDEPAGNPFEQNFRSRNTSDVVDPEEPIIKTPPAAMGKGPSSAELGTIDAVLVSEKDLDETMQNDYPDSFITQVYNYLSLGYPTLARPFDAELAKISRFDIAVLRQDDKKAIQQPRGYIRLGPDFEGGGGEVSETNCMRWQALKVYVREWARQEKNMIRTDGVFGNFGTAARRGSWAG
jgi:hypothetical protein